MERQYTISQLIQAYVEQNDEKSFQGLFEYFFPRLTNFAFTFIHNNARSEDLVMDVFEKIWKKQVELNKIRNIKSFLYTSVRNICIDEIRKNKEIISEDIDNLESKVFLTKRTPENILIEDEMHRKLNSMISELPPKSKTVYMLIKEEGFSYQEAADLLNLSSKTIDYHVNYAMKKIRAGVSSYLNASDEKPPLSALKTLFFML